MPPIPLHLLTSLSSLTALLSSHGRESFPLLFLDLHHRAGVLQTGDNHEDTRCESPDCALRDYPAHALDIGAGVGVESYGDAVVEFLNLVTVSTILRSYGECANYLAFHTPLLIPNRHLAVVKHALQVVFERTAFLRQSLA